jgi:hypothetical protein
MRTNGSDPRKAHHTRRTYQYEAMSKQLANIHDAFFRQILSDPNLAGTFLSEHLPPDVAGLLDPTSPVRVRRSVWLRA